jgi:hypothetical protein
LKVSPAACHCAIRSHPAPPPRGAAACRRDDLAHLRLDRGQVVLGEGPRRAGREVIIKAVVGRGAEGDLRAGPQRLHRFGQHMGKVVPRQFQRVRLVLGGDEREACVTLQRAVDVDQFAIDPRGERRLGKTGADRGRSRARDRDAGVLMSRSWRGLHGWIMAFLSGQSVILST